MLGCSFNDLVGRRLAWSLAHQAYESEKLYNAQKENLLVPHDRKTLFSSPALRYDNGVAPYLDCGIVLYVHLTLLTNAVWRHLWSADGWTRHETNFRPHSLEKTPIACQNPP